MLPRSCRGMSSSCSGSREVGDVLNRRSRRFDGRRIGLRRIDLENAFIRIRLVRARAIELRVAGLRQNHEVREDEDLAAPHRQDFRRRLRHRSLLPRLRERTTPSRTRRRATTLPESACRAGSRSTSTSSLSTIASMPSTRSIKRLPPSPRADRPRASWMWPSIGVFAAAKKRP